MKILYLGYPENSIHSFLQTKGTVFQTQEKISFEVNQFDWIISYGYSHIIKQDVIDSAKNSIINLHISYLPYNRGADPNFWSWLENTPKGVTIHQIDKGIDTGDIFIQKEIKFEENESLSSSYEILRKEIETLFIENFDNIIKGSIFPKKQKGKGTYHSKKDLEPYKYLLTQGWNTPVKQIKMTDLEIIDEIEKVRSKNNVNWMDVLRLAFTHAPNEARAIMAKINKDDNRISELLEKLSNNGK
jgi:methionyl-tRNA formyltransferase